MPTPWTNQPKIEGAPSITYNDPLITYNQANINYNGQIVTTWNNQQKT